MTVRVLSLGTLIAARDGTIDPALYPDEQFCLYSIPSFDTRSPEILRGSAIGSAKQLVRPGDVLLSRIVPHIRRAWIVSEHPGLRTIASSEWIVFRSAEVDPRFLRYFLTADQFHRQFMQTVAGVGGSLLRARPAQVAEIQISVPDLEQQRRVADILDKAEAIRRKREEAVALTQVLARSAFLEMFGDPMVNPKQWPVCSLGEVSDVGGGLQVTTARAGYELSMPYLRVANVFRDRLELSEVKEIRVTAAESKRAELREGDVLVVEGHGNPEELGRAAVWNGEIPGCTHQNHLIRVRPDPSKVRSVFLSAFLNSTSGRAQMLSLGKTTSGLNTISTSNVRSIRLLLPPLTLQRDFEHIVRKVRCLASRMRRDANEEVLFDTLSGLAFSGQLSTEAA